MTDQYLPPPADQQDTAVFARPQPTQPGAYPTVGGYPPAGYGPSGNPAAGYPGPGNPQADYWQSRYRRQRRWTWVLAVLLVLGGLGAVATGAIGWQLLRANPLATSVSDLAGGLGAESDGPVPGLEAPQGEDPQAGERLPDRVDDLPVDSLPIPQEIKDLAATFGITDVGQLLDLAVANGLMSAEDAEQIRAAIRAGAVAPDLSGGTAG